MTEIKILTKEEIHYLREKFMVRVGGFGEVESSDLKPLFNSYLSLITTIESQKEEIEKLREIQRALVLPKGIITKPGVNGAGIMQEGNKII